MIAFFLVLVAVAIAAEIYTLRHSLDGISYDCRPSEVLVEPGQKVQLITTVTNRKRRMVPFLRLQELVPLSFQGDVILETESITDARGSINSAVYMMPRQRMTRRIEFSMPDRGRYLFLGANLSGGDFMGLSERMKNFPLEREIVVLPKRLPADVAEDMMGGMMGDISVSRFIFEDPVLTVGFREYTGHEPLKMISWTQSARTGELQVKNYDYTIEREVAVILNVDTFAFGPFADMLKELCFSMARSVCEELEDRKIAYSYLSNAACDLPKSDMTDVVNGLGPAHMGTIMESLGRAKRENGITMEALLDIAARRAESGMICIYISPMPEDAEEALLAPIRARTGSDIYTLIAKEVQPE